MLDVNLILTSKKIKVKRNKKMWNLIIKKEIKWCMQKEEQVSFLAEKIRQADAVFNRRWFWSFQCGGI